MIDLRRLNAALARMQWVGGLAKLSPLLVGSVLVTLLATAASPGPTDWFFQSPVSPVSPISPAYTIGPIQEGPTGTPEATVAGPALVAVPAASNFIPWLVGILLVAAIVGAATLWSRRRDKGDGRA